MDGRGRNGATAPFSVEQKRSYCSALSTGMCHWQCLHPVAWGHMSSTLTSSVWTLSLVTGPSSGRFRQPVQTLRAPV